MFQIPQAHKVDGYKLGHIDQYVENTESVYANLTPRSDRLANVVREHFDNKVVLFGIDFAIKSLTNNWNETFFNKPKEEVIKKFSRRVKNYLGFDHGDSQIQAMADLHDLGYLPLKIKALPEGSRVNMQVPVLTVQSTDDRFYWLTNYSETFISCMTWPLCNAASLADQYYQTSKRWGEVTGAGEIWLSIANHCFAARGHRGDQDAMISGMAHLLFSVGTDTLWAIDGMEEYYNADSDKELVACSVNAFEHATATQRIAYYRNQLGYNDFPLQAETESIRDICTGLYPTGIVSYVSDSEDYYGVLTTILPSLKEEILARTEDSLGLCKFVCRPDSSPNTPLEVICGYKVRDITEEASDENCPAYISTADIAACYKGKGYTAVKLGDKYFDITGEDVNKPREIDEAEAVGTMELLWRTFGGIVNEDGFKVLNPKVGMIYGEAININLQEKIYQTLAEDGWCVSNVLFGVGSWGFLENSSRDTYGFAIKGTHSIVDGEDVSMQKTPKTAAVSKRSAKGYQRVEFVDGEFVSFDEQTAEQEAQGLLEVVMLNSDIIRESKLSVIREKVQS